MVHILKKVGGNAKNAQQELFQRVTYLLIEIFALNVVQVLIQKKDKLNVQNVPMVHILKKVGGNAKNAQPELIQIIPLDIKKRNAKNAKQVHIQMKEKKNVLNALLGPIQKKVGENAKNAQLEVFLFLIGQVVKYAQ